MKKKINPELIRVYKLFDEINEPKCSGCGRWDVKLSHSHLIRRSYRKDLETDINNIRFHCLSIGNHKGCHDRWEAGGHGMLDYDRNMAYIKSVDETYYQMYKSKKPPK